MTRTYTFSAKIEGAGGGGAFVRIPFDVEQAFGRKRVPVLADIEGQHYRGTLVRMGEPCHLLPILKEIRKIIGKEVGETVAISLQEDLLERRVELPNDLADALDKDEQARAAFERLSYTHKKEHVQAILQAKKEETRQRRIARTIEMLKQGRKT